jgi:two-component system LytT family response regulator
MMRVLIVDDEAPARRKLRGLLQKAADVEIAGEAADGAGAVSLIGATGPDVVFLDIQMPVLDGFGVIDRVGAGAMPLVVFVTAYDEHALRAFDVHALDYLLKPVSPSRFDQVLDPVRAQVAARDHRALAERLERALAALRPVPHHLQRILVERRPEHEVRLPLDRVDVLRAERNHVGFITGDGEYTRRMPLGEVGGQLDPDRFLQINRSEIVRLDAVAEFQPWFHGDYRVVMKSGARLTWSRRYRAKTGGKL